MATNVTGPSLSMSERTIGRLPRAARQAMLSWAVGGMLMLLGAAASPAQDGVAFDPYAAPPAPNLPNAPSAPAPARTTTAETPDSRTIDAPLTESDLQTLRTADPELFQSQAILDAEVLRLDEQDLPVASPAAKSPATDAYRDLFYDNDFRYLNMPGDYPLFLGDHFKQLTPGDNWIVDVGGEYRLRQHNEAHLRFSDLSGRSDNFLLERTRLYSSVRYGGFARFYGEMLDATSNWQNYSPRDIEVNRFDALNLFAESRVTFLGDGEWWVRGGRQELLFGDQRLVSPLDWANTRRTFDGLKAYHRSTDFDLDVFWTRPVPLAQHLPFDHNFDRSGADQEFYGLFGTYKGLANHVFDVSYLGLGDDRPVSSVSQTFSGRWLGKRDGWLAEASGGYQFGRLGALDRSAGFAVVGGGREMTRLPWSPTIWAYFDWASGDRDPTDGQRNTFQQLFPQWHMYLGYCDLVARQNIQDFNVRLTAKPSDRISLLAWWHVFHLAQARDALYNAAGVPIRSDPTGAAGIDVGQELDLTLTYALDERTELLFGYSHFWAGDFVRATNPPGVSGDVDFTYAQLQWRF